MNFAAIYESELSYVWNALRSLGVRGHDLEDLTHEVFATAFRRREAYDPARPLQPWLFGIAFRTALDFRRLARNRREVMEEPEEVVDGRLGPDEKLGADQERALLFRALDELTLDRRAVLVMHDLNEHRMPEVAEALSIPLNTAYSRLRLARADLAETVRRLCPEGGDP
ncbi:MAG: RNA polymerase sigma factor [Myxococcaceae bacterium]